MRGGIGNGGAGVPAKSCSPHKLCVQIGRCNPDRTLKVYAPCSDVMTNPLAPTAPAEGKNAQ
jgi:hypothetical protein